MRGSCDKSMFYTIAIVVIFLLAIACFCDFRSREIPDWIAVSIALLAVGASLLGWWDLSITWAITGGLVGLLIGYASFHFAKLGGGDAKLIAAIGWLVGPFGLLIVLFGTAVAGGVLALIAVSRGEKDYAYAPAIALGFLGYLGFVSQL